MTMPEDGQRVRSVISAALTTAADTRYLLDSQVALRRVTSTVAAGESPEKVFEAVTAEASLLLGEPRPR